MLHHIKPAKFLLIIFATVVIVPVYAFADTVAPGRQNMPPQSNLATISITPDDIFNDIRNFLTISPHVGSTTGFTIDIGVNKNAGVEAKSSLRALLDSAINYMVAIGNNINTKYGVNVLGALQFFWNNLYAMFATTLNIIKGVLP